ncbi:ABC-F family ATP-binding cassette domain-containing protein [Legionella yabuuchiae]|uniref:ABC-F family ATP-binding cassette domain-containing protein n=1 Tax=Legionella yabuuchiae TaxID=376727 RepID=UPI001055B628|nr:ABC-F family ATP-binding cassette domain-containing protein [Legionella yabuuchiae]
MMTINQLAMAYGSKILFYDVNLKLNAGNCYALVGANGCGKSTFFRILNGDEEHTAGEVQFPKDASFGWLKQDHYRYENTPVKEVVLMGKQPLYHALKRRDELYKKTDWDDETGFKLAELEEKIAELDGYQADSEIEAILTGLGIPDKHFNQPLKALSGGYKLRVLLAQTLYQNPTVLLLDEPTNHLDILSIRWLERFLKNQFSGLVVFISHDIGFIDNLADHILDLDYGEIRMYPGKYNRFLQEKKLLEEQRETERKNTESKISELQKFIDKNKAKASRAGQARSRMKLIEKIQIPDVKKSSRIAPSFSFHIEKLPSKQILTVSQLSKCYGDKTLFSDLDFKMNRGEKLAIMGVNGIGKSTLVKTLLSHIPYDSGEVEWGYGTQISYFSQDHHDLLNTSSTVLNWLEDQVSGQSQQSIRKVLGQVLFSQDDVLKDILLTKWLQEFYIWRPIPFRIIKLVLGILKTIF